MPIRHFITGFSTMTDTAARLGISRKTLWQKMKRYGLSRTEVAGKA